MNTLRSGEKAKDISHANDVVMAHILETLRHGQFTGSIILHVNAGVIKKHERRDMVTTATLLSERNGQ